uniref:HEPN domain-containing protein n=1 Tax=Acinetobacter sp. P8-3-8 TaxID=1029823 RepID=UPI0002487DFC
MNTFVSIRLENIEARFSEIDTLLELAKNSKSDSNKYSALCRSAHILLVSHVEGIYKDIVKDIIDDLNNHTQFDSIPLNIFRTFSLDFTHSKNDDKFNEALKNKLRLVCKDYKTQLTHHPFLRVDNKNPTARILEEILEKFGEKNFFNSLSESKLEIVFENNIKASLKELERIKKYIKKGTCNYPYTIDKSYYISATSKP